MAEPDDNAEGEAPTERTLRSLEELHVRHYRDMPQLARLSRRATAVLAEPVFIGAVLAGVAIWVLTNTAGARIGIAPFDPPPFALLEFAGAIFAVLTTLLILGTQTREYRLEEQRSQLTLQLAALSEQKIAKVIALIEEQRRDSPHLESRHDAEAEAMAAPSDPDAVVERIAETQKTPD